MREQAELDYIEEVFTPLVLKCKELGYDEEEEEEEEEKVM